MELHTGTKKGTFALSLVNVQKPHTASITAMKQSPSGEPALRGRRGNPTQHVLCLTMNLEGSAAKLSRYAVLTNLLQLLA